MESGSLLCISLSNSNWKLVMIEKINNITSLCLKLALTIGFVFIFLYCFFSIHWFPIGVSFSETISLLMLALGMGVIILIFILVPADFLAEGFNSLKKMELSSAINQIITAVILVVFWCVKIGITLWELFVVFSVILSYSFFIYQVFYGKFFKDLKSKLLYVAIFSIFSIFLISINQNSQAYITKQLGFSYSRVALQLSEQDFQLVKVQINQYRLTNIKYDEQTKIIYPIDIKLRGIGTYTLIEFGDGKRQIRMEIKTEESKIIRVEDIK